MKIVMATGKRKTAVARAVIRDGNGQIRINKVPIEIYPHEIARMKIMEPIILAKERISKVNIDVNVRGGGVMGQSCAVRTSIAKGLVEFFEDDELESIYRQYDRSLLVSNPRRKLPKKPCGRGARKKRQKSYR